MGVHLDKFSLHKEAFEENLEAVKVLISYKKDNLNEKWLDSKGCLGYSATTLLFSFVNAYGNLFYETKILEKKIQDEPSTFHILNSEYFNSQKLSENILKNLYQIYRSKLTHNLALPRNYFLEIRSENNSWYKTSRNHNGNDVISTIYLYNLLQLCNSAYEKILNEHELRFLNSPKIKNLGFTDISENNFPKDLNASGIINSDMLNLKGKKYKY